MQKILLYYKFTPLGDPEAIRLWQRALCEQLRLKGRILISTHGINGTVGGDVDDLKAYVKATKAYAPFKGTAFKWSDGHRDDFPKLSIKVRDEIVSFGTANELEVDDRGVVGGGTHLRPEDVHRLVEEHGKDVVFFDGRNKHEAAVGKFKGAIVPDVSTSKDFVHELDSGKYDDIKDKKIITYCTGGVRCEILSSLMKKRGFRDVYQIDGGIATYGQAYGDAGLWEGKLYVFDDRQVMQFSDEAQDIGSCVYCRAKTSNYENCADNSCNQLMLICKDCANRTVYCPKEHQDTTSVVTGVDFPATEVM